jgi:hypothetical protein
MVQLSCFTWHCNAGTRVTGPYIDCIAHYQRKNLFFSQEGKMNSSEYADYLETGFT